MSWLEELKVGDEVVVAGDRYHLDYVDKVTKLTAKQIALENSSYRYRRDTGSQIGGDNWNSRRLEEATPERKKEAQREYRRLRMIQTLTRTVWKELSDETLERVLEVIKTV